MSAPQLSELRRLADLLRQYNAIGDAIAGVIGRPAERGHVGEYIAARIFDITLERSARKRARDGRFMAGALAGHTVNVKWYGKQEGVLDLHSRGAPDYYLTLTGPAGTPIDHALADVVKLGTTTSVSLPPLEYEPALLPCEPQLWGRSEGNAASKRRVGDPVVAEPRNATLVLSQEQRDLLALFRPVRGTNGQ